MTGLRATAAAVGLVAGIVMTDILGRVPNGLVLGSACLAGMGLSLWMLREERRQWREWPRWAIAGAMLLMLYPAGAWRSNAVRGKDSPESLRARLAALPDDAAFTVRGIVASEPEIRSGTRTDLRVRVQALRAEPDGAWLPVRTGRILVRVYRRTNSRPEAIRTFRQISDPLAYGDDIELALRSGHETRLLNPGQFDYASFLGQQGLEYAFSCDAGRIRIMEVRRGHPVKAFALAVKRRFLDVYRLTMRSPASRLAAAATLGNRHALDGIVFRGRPIPETFRHAGVGHVLAVSGLHVSVITVLLYALFRMAGLKPRLFVPPLIVLLLLFAILTGARPSSVRAVIMNMVILTILAYGHGGVRQATVNGLGISALGILLHHPPVLYAPSFLLSYGAVLALIVLAPPLDRALLKLRGFGLLAFILWLASVMLIGAVAFRGLRGAAAVTLMLALGWGGVLVGQRLNDLHPRAWSIGLHRIPAGLRIFLSAQLAIQIGMIIPLSAWFFGQLPVAGVLVNCVAIPLVGVLVQLGILTGLIGLIPVVGVALAAPFGAANTLVCHAFMQVAGIGAALFPFPAVPQPKPVFLAVYYLALLALVLIDRRRAALSARVCGLARWPRRFRVAVVVAWAVPGLLAAGSLWQIGTRKTTAGMLLCLADGDTPLLAIVSDTHAAVLINAGNRATGRFLLFDVLRRVGAARIETAVLPATRPSDGIEGIVALGERMEIGRVLLSVQPANPDDFISAIGDPYLARHASAGARWAVAHADAYAALLAVSLERGFPLSPMGTGSLAPDWRGLHIESLPLSAVQPDRFVQSARTPILLVTFHGSRWVVLTDSAIEVLKALPPFPEGCDVLLLPDRRSRRENRRFLDAAIAVFDPGLVILAGDRLPAEEPDFPAHRLIATGRDGAVIVSPRHPTGMMIETHLTRRRFSGIQPDRNPATGSVRMRGNRGASCRRSFGTSAQNAADRQFRLAPPR